MNDWDNQDNLPPDDDESFDWMNESDDDTDWSSDDEDLSWLTGDDEESDDAEDEQAWKMPNPSRIENDIAAKMDDAEEADFGNTDELLDWMAQSDESSDDDSENAWDASEWDGDDLEDDWAAEVESDDLAAGNDDWLAPSDNDEAVDDFLTEMPDSDAEADDFLFASTVDDDDQSTDDFLLSSDNDEAVDDFLAATSDDNNEVDDFLFDSVSDEDDAVVLDETVSELDDEWDALTTDIGDFGDEDDFDAASTGELEDLGAPDWLMEASENSEPDMPSVGDSELDYLSDADPVIEGETDDFGFDELLDEAETSDEELGDVLASLETDADSDEDLDDLLSSLDAQEDVSSPDLQDEELERLNQLRSMRTADLSFEDGLDGENVDIPDLSPDELELLNQLDADEVDDLDFVEASSDLRDEELERLNQLRSMRTADLSFEDGVELPDLGTDELELFNQLGTEDIDDLDFLGESQAEFESDFSDESIAQTEEETEYITDLNQISSDELDFLVDVDPEEAEEYWRVQEANRIQTADLELPQELEEMDAADFVDEETDTAFDLENEPDWLDEISGIDTDTLNEAVRETGTQRAVDIDALIASFDTDEDVPDEKVSAANLQAIFDQLDEEQRSQLPDDLPADALPEWLQEIAKGTDASSAAALVRQRRDRSLEDLDDRLLDLRERGLELSPETATPPEDQQRLAKVVPNLDEALTPARMTVGQSSILTEPNISPEQRERANLLSNLVGTSLGTDTAATLNDNQTEQSRNPLKAILKRLDRVLLSLLLVAAVIAPFVYPTFSDLASLPPIGFESESDEFTAFAFINDLEPNELVLVATEYGASGARELDDTTRVLMEHIIINGAIPVVVSSDTVGLLRAENILVDLLGEEQQNVAYYVAGFLPGGTIGLRDFAENVRATIGSDIRGNDNGLTLKSLDGFASIVLISESGETVRNWMEQVAPETATSIIVATGQAAYPLALPYVDSTDNAIALFSGYEDAYTYQQMLVAAVNPSETPTPTLTLTSTPSLTPTVMPTETATNTPEPTATLVPSETPEPSATSVPSETPEEPEETLAPSATLLPTDTEAPASETPIPIVTVTPDAPATATLESSTSQLIEVGTVNTTENIEARSGAGINFDVVTELAPETRLVVLNMSLDEQWLEVELPDESTAWVQAEALDVVQMTQEEFEEPSTVATEAVDDTIQVGIVIADGRVNIRSGAGSSFTVIAGLDPDTRVRVLSLSDDTEWYNIVLPDGSEGWIASFLLLVEEIPADEWDGASKDGFYPVYFSHPRAYQQDDTSPEDEDGTLLIGRNAAGVTMPVYTSRDQSEVLVPLPNGAEFIVLEEGVILTRILLEDGQEGFIETRVIVTEERARDEVDFAPTPTLAPTSTPIPSQTPTPLPTVTFTPTPFVAQITPVAISNPEVRSSSQALGLVTAIALIALGNLFWIFRWLGKREQ